MALIIGNESAASGMAKHIYDRLNEVLQDDLEGLSDEDKNPIRENWKKMAYAIAKGVIEHITANMEIFGVTAQGNVNAAVSGNTAAAPPGPHLHAVNLSGVQNNAVFTQNNDGTGHVR